MERMARHYVLPLLQKQTLCRIHFIVIVERVCAWSSSAGIRSGEGHPDFNISSSHLAANNRLRRLAGWVRLFYELVHRKSVTIASSVWANTGWPDPIMTPTRLG
jgi:hypothetical protein